MKSTLDFSRYFRLVDSIDPRVAVGTVTEMVGLLIESSGPATALGDFCEIHTTQSRTVRVQVIGFRNGRVLSMPLEETGGIQMGDRIVARPVAALVKAGPGLLGRVLDGFGEPMDGGDPIEFHFSLARLSALHGDVAAACRRYQESLVLLQVGFQEFIPSFLEGLGTLVAEQAVLREAVRLWGTRSRKEAALCALS